MLGAIVPTSEWGSLGGLERHGDESHPPEGCWFCVRRYIGEPVENLAMRENKGDSRHHRTSGETIYDTELVSLDRCFLHFAMAARFCC